MYVIWTCFRIWFNLLFFSWLYLLSIEICLVLTLFFSRWAGQKARLVLEGGTRLALCRALHSVFSCGESTSCNREDPVTPTSSHVQNSPQGRKLLCYPSRCLHFRALGFPNPPQLRPRSPSALSNNIYRILILLFIVVFCHGGRESHFVSYWR